MLEQPLPAPFTDALLLFLLHGSLLFFTACAMTNPNLFTQGFRSLPSFHPSPCLFSLCVFQDYISHQGTQPPRMCPSGRDLPAMFTEHSLIIYRELQKIRWLSWSSQPISVGQYALQAWNMVCLHRYPQQYNSVLVRVSMAVMKHCDQKQIGEGRVRLTSTSLFMIGRSHDRNTSRKEPGGRS